MRGLQSQEWSAAAGGRSSRGSGSRSPMNCRSCCSRRTGRCRPVSRFARAPVRLLLPEHGVVPFLGREQPLAELQGWCHGPARFALRVLTGDGGAGKTRLAAELAINS